MTSPSVGRSVGRSWPHSNSSLFPVSFTGLLVIVFTSPKIYRNRHVVVERVVRRSVSFRWSVFGRDQRDNHRLLSNIQTQCCCIQSHADIHTNTTTRDRPMERTVGSIRFWAAPTAPTAPTSPTHLSMMKHNPPVVSARCFGQFVRCCVSRCCPCFGCCCCCH